jgi:hypothetical protein
MTPRCSSRVGLVVSVTVIWLIAGTSLLHAHRGEASGLYDEDCPLSQLAARCSEVGVAPAVDEVQPSPAVDLALPPTLRESSPAFIGPFNPRGPPITG